MTDASGGADGLDRRGFIQLAAAGPGLAGGIRAAVAQGSETTADITRQPSPSFLVEAGVDAADKPPKRDDLKA